MIKIPKRIILTLIFFSLFLGGLFIPTNATTEDIDWNNKMTNGKTICYYISTSCEYTVTIPNAVNKLVYPLGMWNPLMLYRTTIQSDSKLDFYQYYSNNNIVATTTCFRKNSSGDYYAMPTYQKDLYDWVYANININDYYMGSSGGFTATEKERTVIHEMLHAYGLKDLYNSSNSGSIMYGYFDGNNATGLTSDANDVLIAKY